jgi:hypothetical protein
MMEAIRSSETSVLTRATRPNVPEDGGLQFHYSFPNDSVADDLMQVVRGDL